MRARMINTFGFSDRLAGFVTHLQQEAIPAVQAQDGYRGMLVLGDRHTDHILVVTFWDSRREERASAHSALIEEQIRAAAPYIGLRITHEALDVVLAAWPGDHAPVGPPFDAAADAHTP